MRFRLNTAGYIAAAVFIAASTVTAQTDKRKCVYTDVTGKVITVLCSEAPLGAKPLTPPVTPAPAPATATPTSQAFPFPGDTAGTTQAGPVATAPAATDSAPANNRFPFPGENPDPAAPPVSASPAQEPSGLKDAGSEGDSTKLPPGTSSSSSSSSANSDSASTTPDPNDPPDAAPIPHHSRRPVPTVKEKTPDEREAEDVSVAAFYMNLNNFQGAYMRGKDAVVLDDSDPAAHLALAEAARKLGKLDEAQQNYKRCLDLDPLPKDRKVAEHALKEMAGKG